jgi:hypothetical protein
MIRCLARTLLVLSTLAFTSSTFAHDIWINRLGLKNPAGEWCCGAGDCGVVSSTAVRTSPKGYTVRGTVTYGAVVTGNSADGDTVADRVDETVPYSQALPSPDGAFWRCKRPDGSRRCFFAPPPGS